MSKSIFQISVLFSPAAAPTVHQPSFLRASRVWAILVTSATRTLSAWPAEARTTAGVTPAARRFGTMIPVTPSATARSEAYTSELQSRPHLVCRLLLEKKKQDTHTR